MAGGRIAAHTHRVRPGDLCGRGGDREPAGPGIRIPDGPEMSRCVENMSG